MKPNRALLEDWAQTLAPDEWLAWKTSGLADMDLWDFLDTHHLEVLYEFEAQYRFWRLGSTAKGRKGTGRFAKSWTSWTFWLRNDALREALAAVQHDIWAHWMEYLFLVSDRQPDGSVVIPADKVRRWKRQLATDYEDLSPNEQASDGNEADKILAVLATQEIHDSE